MEAEQLGADFLQQITNILNYKLFELDGSPVSVAKLITGLVLLIVGYYLAGRASKEVDRRLLGRLAIDESLRYTFQRLIFYFFLCVVTLFTLRTLNVPITIFTVIGGALAVGIGFGSQNLVNNFISGVLVMVERPVRIGDFVEVDGVTGHVVNIGIRSTTVKTLANAAVIVNNTSLIEKNLTNWSYSHSITDTVRVGVAYGTDLKALKQICYEALEQVKDVQNPRESTILFIDFGDNALIFDLAYNIPSGQVGVRGRIRSDIRYQLNEQFLKHKVSVPFPQRDIHIVDAPPGLIQSRNQ